MVLPCSMFALDGKFAGFPPGMGQMVDVNAPVVIGDDCEAGCPGGKRGKLSVGTFGET